MESKTNHNLNITDMNGNVLFNSDRIRMGDFEGTITYDTNNCRFMVEWEDGSKRPMTAHFASQIVKIS